MGAVAFGGGAFGYITVGGGGAGLHSLTGLGYSDPEAKRIIRSALLPSLIVSLVPILTGLVLAAMALLAAKRSQWAKEQ